MTPANHTVANKPHTLEELDPHVIINEEKEINKMFTTPS
jgi:hypothetical protein